MKRFTANIAKEMSKTYPDRRKLEMQCFTNIVFGEKMTSETAGERGRGDPAEGDHLELGCWIMLINIVALHMLKSHFPSGGK